MCNRYKFNLPLERILEDFSEIRIPLRFPIGMPNLEPSDYAITDRAPIVVAEPGGGRFEMMRWSWPGPSGSPVFNFRSEGRRFDKGRCLILTDGFYEFTKSPDAAKKTKDKWLFTMADGGSFALAGYVRQNSANGADAWTMLTTEPGPDVAPYHNRQVVVLPQATWGAWLSGEPNEKDMCRPLPAGALSVRSA